VSNEDDMPFDPDRFIDDCCTAMADAEPQRAAREVLTRAVSEPRDVLAALGAPERPGIRSLYRADDLTIISGVFPANVIVPPHEHRMWAVIGIVSGREDNVFWRRVRDEDDSHIEAAGAQSLCEKDVTPLGRDIVHSVINPLPRLSMAIHIYGGDFFGVERSEWDPETLSERPYDLAGMMALLSGDGAR
jgi:predicted metal-dependent enzyme (double-stranded beta helix superfamily)